MEEKNRIYLNGIIAGTVIGIGIGILLSGIFNEWLNLCLM